MADGLRRSCYVLGVSGPFKLQSLLALREQAQAEAEVGLRVAIEQLEAATMEQRRLSALVQGYEARLLRLVNGPLEGRTASALQARDQFMVRLREDVRQSQGELARHEAGALAQALRAEQQARDQLLVAKQELELLHRHKDQTDVALRKSAERREDQTVDDWSQGRRR